MKNEKESNTNKSRYTALDLIRDLKQEIEKATGNKISDENLSIFLGKNKTHITRKKTQIKENPNYIYPENVLDDYIQNLESTYAEKAIKFIYKYFERNNVPKVIKGVLRFHPHLKIDYFKEINTKEKAYWLGFLFADGWISQSNVLVVGVEISVKDDMLLELFSKTIGFNLDFKDHVQRDNTVRIRFKNNEFAENLIKHGMIVGKEKSKNIQLPKLNNRSVYLAFLLGYFDGDGKEGTTSIKSGSKLFLEQIKNKFKLKTKISTIRYKLKNGQESEAYDFWLGGKLFNEMMENYKNSLYRKRRSFEVYEDESLRHSIMSFKASMNKMLSKYNILIIEDKKFMTKYAWDFGRKHNFPYSLIKKLCNQHNLESPLEEDWD